MTTTKFGPRRPWITGGPRILMDPNPQPIVNEPWSPTSIHPTPEVVQAIEAGITNVTRRLEIYEADGVTPYYPNGSEEDIFRLLSGGISIDSTRSERRSADLTLDNVDNNLRPQANGLWYDKIFKPYRGVKYQVKKTTPRILIADSPTLAIAQTLKGTLGRLGFYEVDIKRETSTLGQLDGYDIVIFDSGTAANAKTALIKSAFERGYNVITFGLLNGLNVVPWSQVDWTVYSGDVIQMIQTGILDTDLHDGWGNGSGIGDAITSNAVLNYWDSTTAIPKYYNAQWVGASYNSAVYTSSCSTGEHPVSRGRWVVFNVRSQSVVGNANFRSLLYKAINWQWRYAPYKEWETPLGEFLPDSIKTQNYPNSVALSLRDKTKILLGSKIEKAVTFKAGTDITDMITALATNAGIKKLKLGIMSGVKLGKDISADRTTERFSLIKQAADFIKSDVYFDRDGWLVLTPWADPSTGAPAFVFKTGPQGNLMGYDRSANDTRIYNHIVVTGTPEGTDATTAGFFGEAKNTNPNSPTSIARLGDRTYFYTSSFFTNNAQCKTHADKLLEQTALESFEFNFSSFVYPWTEVGVVADILDPDNAVSDPTRFLMDTATVSLDLGPMTATAKRVGFVEDLI